MLRSNQVWILDSQLETLMPTNLYLTFLQVKLETQSSDKWLILTNLTMKILVHLNSQQRYHQVDLLLPAMAQSTFLI